MSSCWVAAEKFSQIIYSKFAAAGRVCTVTAGLTVFQQIKQQLVGFCAAFGMDCSINSAGYDSGTAQNLLSQEFCVLMKRE